jgi:hypothetical protein
MILEIERGNSRSPSWGKSLWKRLWTCFKDYGINNLLSNVTPVTATAEYGSVEVQLHLALDEGDW